MTVTKIDATPDDSFAYPYYLHVPDGYTGDKPLLVESTNTGEPSDDFKIHEAAAERRVEQGFSRGIADHLGVPFLHPVFPRPRSDPVDWTHSIHQLCYRSMRIEDGPLARVDRQLLAMIDDARERLPSEPPERILLNGFSSSATFANRFTVLHPDRVRAVSTGGFNGLATLPLTKNPTNRSVLSEHLPPLNYPVGVADVAELTGKAFDIEALRAVPQFIYQGGADDHDPLLYPDAWTEIEPRTSAIFAYGPDIHDDRLPECAAVYADADLPAVFRVYPDEGHTPEPAIDDIITFFERALASEDISVIQESFGGEAV